MSLFEPRKIFINSIILRRMIRGFHLEGGLSNNTFCWMLELDVSESARCVGGFT